MDKKLAAIILNLEKPELDEVVDGIELALLDFKTWVWSQVPIPRVIRFKIIGLKKKVEAAHVLGWQLDSTPKFLDATIRFESTQDFISLFSSYEKHKVELMARIAASSHYEDLFYLGEQAARLEEFYFGEFIQICGRASILPLDSKVNSREKIDTGKFLFAAKKNGVNLQLNELLRTELSRIQALI